MSSLIILVLVMISGTSSSASPRRREIEISRSPATSSNDSNFDVSKLSGNRQEIIAGRLDIKRKTMKNDDEENARKSLTKEDREAILKKVQRKRALALDYPLVPRIARKRRAISKIEKQSLNHDRTVKEQEEKKLSNEKRNRRDSPIYFIKLPPTPYSYVPGYGYISRPPIPMIPGHRRPSINHLHRPSRPQTNHRVTTESPVIRVPIHFVNNGKLGGVYQLTDNSIESTLNRLDHGAYFFNGRPTSLYLLKNNGRKTEKRPMRLSYQSKIGNHL